MKNEMVLITDINGIDWIKGEVSTYISTGTNINNMTVQKLTLKGTKDILDKIYKIKEEHYYNVVFCLRIKLEATSYAIEYNIKDVSFMYEERGRE